MNPYFQPTLREGHPDFLDLPWSHSLAEWTGICHRLEEVQRGLSRHPVVFVNYDGTLYAIKELPPSVAQAEYQMLCEMEALRLPCVMPVGHAQLRLGSDPASALITRYLEGSIPYRSLFMHSHLDRYREHLLDAMAGLLVQLHLAGIYWGDCSLSNTLFRRDAGALQAYLVDAETAESHPPHLSPMLRYHDLEIMEENLSGDLADLATLGYLSSDFPIHETGTYIRQRYRGLWSEITREEIINPDERYRVQERIRSLNALGFSVRDVELHANQAGDKLRLRIFVTDRNFHRDRLLEIAGIEAEESQARQIFNEIQELKAYLSQENNRSVPLSAAAYHWLENYYQPVIARLQPLIHREATSQPTRDPVELYCQVLEHKWFLSERAQHDVGHLAAVDDYLDKFSQQSS
ncbi:MAG: DUF4032 domain-containing protein [Anaerolineales bacterium]|nr:DUF4032 domain-containing protein [Anaerolineales bacterium]